MSNVDVIRAWKDEEYRLSLSDAERAALPANPAGLIELAETDLEGVAGGRRRPPTTKPGSGCGTGKGTGGNCTKCKPVCG
jgi:mersacidin/lichenicidin family type 2 lantibiotic